MGLTVAGCLVQFNRRAVLGLGVVASAAAVRSISQLRRYEGQCRDAAKIDRTRLATLTKLGRVAEACQSSLHIPRSVTDYSAA